SRTTSEVNYKFIRYSGKERDVTGLYYYGVRYYQPWIGRWINPDPGGTVDGQNLYCMVGNNPSTDVDQTGLAKKKRSKDEQGLPESKIARMSGPTASASSGPAPGNQDLGPLSLDIPESSTFGPSTSASSGEQGRREDLLKLLRSPIPAPPPLSEEEKAIRMKSPLLYDLLHASGSSGASGLWTSATQGRDAANQMREITELLPARTGQPNTPIDRSISSLGRESRGYVDEWAKGLSSGRCLVLPRTGGWCTPSVALTAQEQAEEPFRATEETFLHGTAAVVETLAAMIRVHVATDELVDIAPVPPGTGNTVVYGNSMLKEFEDAFSPNSLPPVRPDLENEIEGAMSKLCLDAFEHAGIEGVISTDLSEQDIDYDFADRAKGYAFAVYATERAAYIIPGVVNLNVGLSDMPWYKGRGPLFRRMKVKEKQTGKEVTRSVYLKPKTDGQIKEFIKWVNTRLEENGHLPLHAVLEKRFKDFCGRDTTAEDFPPHHKYEPACNREMPALAGVMGTHAETILYNRLLTEIFKDYHGADLEKKEHLANKLFLKYIGVFTMQLLNAKKRVESGIVPFPLFAPCIGCKTMMGPGGMAFQYARIAKSFAENQKDILSVPFDQRNDYLKGKYGFLR
ncbi:RHS repeat-associated core domain-containing protein, partial [Achromobacter aloeverae]